MKHRLSAFLLFSIISITNTAIAYSKPTNQQWLGWWRTADQLYSIEIKPDKNGLVNVEGNGTWQHFIKLNDGRMEKCPHYNQFGGILKPSGNVLTYWPYRNNDKDSKNHYVKMTLNGSNLIVDDQLEDFDNINFSGSYQKYTRPNKR